MKTKFIRLLTLLFAVNFYFSQIPVTDVATNTNIGILNGNVASGNATINASIQSLIAQINANRQADNAQQQQERQSDKLDEQKDFVQNVTLVLQSSSFQDLLKIEQDAMNIIQEMQNIDGQIADRFVSQYLQNIGSKIDDILSMVQSNTKTSTAEKLNILELLKQEAEKSLKQLAGEFTGYKKANDLKKQLQQRRNGRTLNY